MQCRWSLQHLSLVGMITPAQAKKKWFIWNVAPFLKPSPSQLFRWRCEPMSQLSDQTWNYHLGTPHCWPVFPPSLAQHLTYLLFAFTWNLIIYVFFLFCLFKNVKLKYSYMGHVIFIVWRFRKSSSLLLNIKCPKLLHPGTGRIKCCLLPAALSNHISPSNMKIQVSKNISMNVTGLFKAVVILSSNFTKESTAKEFVFTSTYLLLLQVT